MEDPEVPDDELSEFEEEAIGSLSDEGSDLEFEDHEEDARVYSLRSNQIGHDDLDAEFDGEFDIHHPVANTNDDAIDRILDQYQDVLNEADSNQLADGNSDRNPGPSTSNYGHEFEWKRETDTDKFEPFIEPFDGISKFNVPLTADSTPWETLQEFIDESMMDDILEQTNIYGDLIKLSKPLKCERVEMHELWSFFGLQILTGIIKKPAIDDYWSTDILLRTPIFGETMSRNKFQNILRMLHFSDNQAEGIDPTDRLYKLGNFLPKLLKKFDEAITKGEFLCVDESLLLFKGRLSFKQYNPKKRARFGFKYFAEVDDETKFLCKLALYLGRKTNVSGQDVKEYGAGGAIVIKLLEKDFGKNHKVVFDNWFNGPKLLKHLRDNDTYGLGTVRKNRKGLPRMSTKLKEGDCEVHFSEDMMMERWMDRREVCILNSFIEHEMLPRQASNPRNQRLKPKSVLIYNKTMGGVDYIDKQLAPYSMLRKSLKWYKKPFFHLLELAIHNSFVVYKNYHPGTKMAYKDFLLSLVREILTKNKLTRPRIGIRLHGQGHLHLPVRHRKSDGKTSHFSDCHHCRVSIKRRKQTAFSCLACGKRLCIDNENSCFKKFHLKLFNVCLQAPLTGIVDTPSSSQSQEPSASAANISQSSSQSQQLAEPQRSTSQNSSQSYNSEYIRDGGYEVYPSPRAANSI